MRKLFFLFAMILATSPVIYTQNLKWEIINTDNSDLPSNWIYEITEDLEGNIWVATDAGLVKITGGAFSVFDSSNTPWSDSYVIDIKVDSSNNIWILEDTDGVFMYDHSDWHAVPVEGIEVPDFHLNSLHLENGGPLHENGLLWVGTYNNGIIYYDGSSWTQVNQSFKNKSVYGIAIEGSGPYNGGYLWAGSDTEFYMFDSNEWQTYTPPVEVTIYNTLKLQDGGPNNNGKIWAGTAGGRLLEFNGSSWEYYNIFDAFNPNVEVISIVIDYQGNIWAGTDQTGLHHYTGTSFLRFGTDNSYIPDDQINAAYIKHLNDHDSLYIGTTAGFARSKIFYESSDTSDTDTTSTAIHPVSAENMQVYPNPAEDHLHFVLSKPVSKLNLSIQSLEGKIMKQHQQINLSANEPYALPVNNIPPGIYIVQITSENNAWTENIIIK